MTVLLVLLPAEGSQAPPILGLCDSADMSASHCIGHWTCRQAESLVQAELSDVRLLLQAAGRAEAVQLGADADLYKVGTGSRYVI